MKTKPLTLLLLFVWFVAAPSQAVDDGVESLRETSKAFASVARNVSPSVVHIQVEGKGSGKTRMPYSSPFGDDSPSGALVRHDHTAGESQNREERCGVSA